MKIIYKNSLAGSKEKANEDSFFIGNNYAFVLDGATSLEKEDVPKYVNTLLNAINTNYSDTLPLKKIIYKSMLDIKKIYPKVAPSATIVMVRITDNKLECLALGDSSIIIKYNNNKVEELIDNSKLFELDKIVYNAMSNLSKSLNIPVIETRNTEKIKNMLLENRRKKNTINGYYILDNDPNAVEFATTFVRKIDNISYIILASDGLTSYYNEMAISSIDVFANNLINDGDKLFSDLRKSEQEDYLCTHVRFKVSDDATGIVIKI